MSRSGSPITGGMQGMDEVGCRRAATSKKPSGPGHRDERGAEPVAVISTIIVAEFSEHTRALVRCWPTQPQFMRPRRSQTEPDALPFTARQGLEAGRPRRDGWTSF